MLCRNYYQLVWVTVTGPGYSSFVPVMVLYWGMA